MKCERCGADLEISPYKNVSQNIVDSIEDQVKSEVCPLCGRRRANRFASRKTLLFGLLKALFLIGTSIEIVFYFSRTTERAEAVKAAIEQMGANQAVVQLLGQPLRTKSGITGGIRHDETGWKEARLTIPVQGPNGEGVAYVVGGKATGHWTFSTFEVLIEKQHKKVDLV